MWAIQIDQPGGPEAMQWRELADPDAGTGHVVVEVAAAGLNYIDTYQRSGLYPIPMPYVLGLEGAGVVSSVGVGAERWSIGDRVAWPGSSASYATKVALPADRIVAVPESVDLETAAAIPLQAMTAHYLITDTYSLAPGDTCLVHAAAGGTGRLIVQMARLRGARVVATTGSDEKLAIARSGGADHAINYRTQDFVEVVQGAGGADVILDMVGGSYIQRNIDAANLNGRICNIAYQDSFEATVNFGPVLMKRLVLTATTLRARPNDQKRAIRDDVTSQFWEAVTSGAIRPVLDSTFPLAEAEAAHARLDTGGHIGKIVLTRD